MSTVKTKISPELVIRYLQKHFDKDVEGIDFIKGGESSQAFRFCSKGDDFIVRVNTSDESFRKDKYAFEHFASVMILIPEILHIGQEEGYAFAISTMSLGVIIKNLPDAQLLLVLPEMISILDTIHSTDISSQAGFGKWNTNGVGEFASWKYFLLNVGMYIESGKLFETTFLEREVWMKIYTEMEILTAFCPEGRYLVHGDYGSDNVISDGRRITGILDWAESIYGDFVYDVAWLSFWGYEKSELYEKPYQERNIPNFKERLLCYKLHIGLGSLSFFAYSQQKDKYSVVRERLLKLL